MKVLFVCLGNICRSPLAEGAFRELLRQRGLQEVFHCDSAGTSRYHIGELPDHRARQTAERRGIALTHRARQLAPHDLHTFDYVLAMDHANLRDIQQLAAQAAAPPPAKIHLLRHFDPHPQAAPEVADPYYGDMRHFEECFETVWRCSEALLDHLTAQNS